jgi:formate hydrogenlyase subunit 6/NADH:ubiquinone oxidoreductase subunit I
MLEILIDKHMCNGCGYCALACPTNCIDLDYDSMKAFVTDISECIVCRNCEEECPKKVIVVKPGY